MLFLILSSLVTLLLTGLLTINGLASGSAERVKLPAVDWDVLGTCPVVPSWSTSQDGLDGTYVANGWENGLLLVLRLTVINGSVSGFLTESTVDENGTEDQETYGVTGTSDDDKVSLRLELLFETVNLVGTWSSTRLELTYPSDRGELTSATFIRADDEEASQLVEIWNDREPRDAGAEQGLSSLGVAYRSISIPFDLSTEPERLSAAEAARFLGMPRQDSLSLLTFGWLASVRFSIRTVGNLPNQVDSFSLHLSSSATESAQLGACAMNFSHFYSETQFKQLTGYPESMTMLTRTLHGSDDIPGSVEVIAILGEMLVISTIYGAEDLQEAGLETVLEILGTANDAGG